jgi:hypothetical protein
MPTVTDIQVDGYVSCIDPKCPGYEQKSAQVTLRTTAFSYQDNGGDGSVPQTAIEREAVGVVQFDDACEVCGKPVIFAAEQRPEYAQVSGQDQLELLAINQQTQIRDVQMANLESAKETAELKTLLAQQGQALAEMQAELARRRGGRPRKDEDSE